MLTKKLSLSACYFAVLGMGASVSSAKAADLQTYEDNAQIVAAGTISNLSDDEFVLTVNGQTINVDYAEWDLLNFTDLENYLQNGEKVVITGDVDDNWFAEDEIEADTIYFTANNTYYSNNGDYPNYNLYYYDSDFASDNNSQASNSNQSSDTSTNEGNEYDNTSMRGTVTSLMDEKFVMKTDSGNVTVNMKPLSPNREESRVHVEQGDDVLVYGRMNNNSSESNMIKADAVVKIKMKNT